MEENKKIDLKHYESPDTRRTVAEPEGSMCVVASGKSATLKKQDAQIEVKEYTTIENNITFE